MEVSGRDEAEFEAVMKKHGCAYGRIGKTKGKKLIITGSGRIIDADVRELKESWQKPLKW